MEIADIYERYTAAGMNVSTDTRNIRRGDLYFALKGEHFNGNLFAAEALEKGAAWAITDEGESKDPRIIRVGHVLHCLQELARFHRRTLKPRVVGIAGSNGKTTTKELVVSVLSTEYNVHYTRGNLNNHIGVPLTLLGLRREHQITVVEMGANREGDIRELCGIAEPDLGLITNIGKEHLEGFGSIEGVARAESELFDYLLKNEGHAFVNADDFWLQNMSKRLQHSSSYGTGVSALTVRSVSPDIRFEYAGLEIVSPLMGDHNLQNIMAAVSVADFFCISPEHLKAGIEKYIPGNNRSQWVHTPSGRDVLLDAYNANPSSVEMALRAFEKTSGRKLVLLGDMFELGAYEASEHQAISGLSATLNFDAVCLVGKAFAATEESAAHVHRFPGREEARLWLTQTGLPFDKILIKGSRGMKMEDFADLF